MVYNIDMSKCRVLFPNTVLMIACAAASIFTACHDAFPQPNFGPATHETDRAVSDATIRKITAKARAPRKVSITIDKNPVNVSQTAESEKFFVNEIRFNGMRALSAQDLSSITKKYTKREISPQEMKNMTKEIEMEYLRRGMISSVFIPEQEITDEILTVQVLEPDDQ